MELRTATREIASYVAGHRSGHGDALVDCLRQVVDQTFLDALLARAATGPNRSYRHPNGFLKIVLLKDPDFQLRLHVWRPTGDAPPATENVHSHRWDFASAVLAGGYRFQEYTPDENGEEFHGFRYHGHDGTTSYSLSPTGPTRLRRTFDAELTGGSSYLLTSNVLHRVVNPAGRTTVTIILQGPHKDAPVDVYAKDAIESGESVELLPLPREALVEEITLVRGLIRTT